MWDLPRLQVEYQTIEWSWAFTEKEKTGKGSIPCIKSELLLKWQREAC